MLDIPLTSYHLPLQAERYVWPFIFLFAAQTAHHLIPRLGYSNGIFFRGYSGIILSNRAMYLFFRSFLFLPAPDRENAALSILLVCIAHCIDSSNKGIPQDAQEFPLWLDSIQYIGLQWESNCRYPLTSISIDPPTGLRLSHRPC